MAWHEGLQVQGLLHPNATLTLIVAVMFLYLLPLKKEEDRKMNALGRAIYQKILPTRE